MKIRRLGESDVDLFRALRLESLADSPDAFGRTLAEEQKLPEQEYSARLGRAWIFVAEDPGVVGVMGLSRDAAVKTSHKAILWGMWVRPSHRRRGVGRRLVEHGLEFLRRETDIEQVLLSVVKDNVAAATLYESLGFRTYGVEPRALKAGGAYFDERHMVRLL